MSDSPHDDRVVARLRELADHARMVPTNADLFHAPADGVVDLDLRHRDAHDRSWPWRAAVFLGFAAAMVGLIYVAVNTPHQRSSSTLVTATTPATTSPSAATPSSSTRTTFTALTASTSAAATTTEPKPIVATTIAPSSTAITIESTSSTSDSTSPAETTTETTSSSATSVRDGAFLATVDDVRAESVMWAVICGQAGDGGEVPRGNLTLPLAVRTVTIDDGTADAPFASTIDAASWKQAPAGRWWVRTKDGAVVEITAATLARPQCA